MCSADAFNADDQWYDVVRRADKRGRDSKCGAEPAVTGDDVLQGD